MGRAVYALPPSRETNHSTIVSLLFLVQNAPQSNPKILLYVGDVFYMLYVFFGVYAFFCICCYVFFFFMLGVLRLRPRFRLFEWWPSEVRSILIFVLAYF